MSHSQERVGRIGKSQVYIGRYTYGVETLQIKQWGEAATLRIGSFCSIAGGAIIFLGGNHRVDWITTFPFGHIFTDELGGDGIKGHPSTNGDVIIGNDVWIGHAATIMSGVKIGNGAVVAANSHVVRDIPDYCIVGGNPARQLKMRFDEETISLLLELSWWEKDIEEIRKISRHLCKEPDKVSLKKLIDGSF